MELRDLQKAAHQTARSKGFYDNEHQYNILERLCLMHSEISEAAEEIRSGLDPQSVYYSVDRSDGAPAKPCGFGIELADLVIRVADMAEFLGIDLSRMIEEKMIYNSTRPHMHGKIC